MKRRHAQIVRAYNKKICPRFSDTSGHCAWIRERVLPRGSSVGCRTCGCETLVGSPAIVRVHRTAGMRVCRAEKRRKHEQA